MYSFTNFDLNHHLESRHDGAAPVAADRVVRTAANDSEVAVLAPVSAPTVSADPVVNAVFIGAPTVELNGVVEQIGLARAAVVALVIRADSSGV